MKEIKIKLIVVRMCCSVYLLSYFEVPCNGIVGLRSELSNLKQRNVRNKAEVFFSWQSLFKGRGKNLMPTKGLALAAKAGSGRKWVLG